ncbi:MAG: DeoR/GlpR family DNA-binding transcription regulator [Candidatus Choladocola sp.]|nr:DeoR/GlpR family DNA-binding transcription regulator [Candidatus Choladocola sp.]
MLAIERKNEILEILQKEQRVLVSELAKRYDVTEETIRRDLEKLERDGFVKKTYGGAVLNKNTSVDLPLRIREKTNRQEKQKVAELASSLIEEGDTIMLDASSTSLMIAQKIKNMEKLTVITTSVEVLIELSSSEGIKVISTGGDLKASSLSLVGRNTEACLGRYNVDMALVSCKGIDMERGIMESNELEAGVKIGMSRSAKQTVFVIDSSKYDKISFVKVMDFSKGDIVVSDCVPDRRWTDYFESKGVRLIVP